MSGPAARPGHGITVESCGSEIERNTSRTSERSGNVGTIWALFESATPRKPPLGPVAGRMLELSKPFEGRVFRILRAAFDPTEPLPPMVRDIQAAECKERGANSRKKTCVGVCWKSRYHGTISSVPWWRQDARNLFFVSDPKSGLGVLMHGSRPARHTSEIQKMAAGCQPARRRC